MKREQIEKAAKEYAETAHHVSTETHFAEGVYWLADYLCKIPFDKIVYELHEYFKNKIEREKNA